MVDYKSELQKYISGKRYKHTLGVEEECERLADIFGLDTQTKQKLAIAGYLHDITKEFSADEHIALCNKYGIEVTEYDMKAPKLFHARTGAYFAREKYPQDVDDFVFNCIYYHTTGCPDMTLCEKLVYLADYIEPNRTFEDCVELRKYFYTRIKNKDDINEVLNDTLIMSFDMTIKDLMAAGKLIDINTVSTRNTLILNRG